MQEPDDINRRVSTRKMRRRIILAALTLLLGAALVLLWFSFDYRTILLLKQIGPGASNAIPALTERLKRSKRKEPYYLKAAEAALDAMSGGKR